MASEVDVVWIEAAEDLLHDTGSTHLLSSVEAVDWLAAHISEMASMDPIERRTYPDQFEGVGRNGTAMAKAMREWIRDTDESDGH